MDNKNNLKVHISLKSHSQMGQEALQSLRTNLQYVPNLQVIALTSTLPSEGKSTIALHLAASFASAGYKTLLIDADMRKSRLRQYTKARLDHRIEGLSDFLSGLSSDIIYQTNIEFLDIIFSGKMPPDPAGSLSSDLFGKLINLLKDTYDYILIDTPPTMAAVDSMIIGRQSDGILYIVCSGKIKRSIANRCIERLHRGGCKVVGICLNAIEKKSLQYNQYYQYYQD